MPGSTRTKKDGRGGRRFSYETPGGTKTLTTTKATKEAADAWLKGEEREHAEGALAFAGGRTVAAYLDYWLRDAAEPSVARRTLEKRAWAANIHIKPAPGKTRLSDLDARAIQRLYAAMAREGYAHGTRLAVHVTLKIALKQAVRWDLIRRNPAQWVDVPRNLEHHPAGDLDHGEGPILHLTDAEAGVFLRTTAGSCWRNCYVAAVRTGPRPGEMLGLRWGNLDLEADPGSLRVKRTLDTHYAAVFSPPKTPRSRRRVALHFEAKDALLSQGTMVSREGLPTGRGSLVFPSRDGTPMSSNNLRKRHLYPALDRA